MPSALGYVTILKRKGVFKMRFVGFIMALIAYSAYEHARDNGITELRTDTIILGVVGVILMFEPLLGAILGKRK